jgi:hypothetical protein
MSGDSWRAWRAKYPDRARESGRQSAEANRSLIAARRRAARLANPDTERQRDRARYAEGRKPRTKWDSLWVRYRLRQPEYEAILERQASVCAICRGAFASAKGTHVDHDHRCDHPGKGTFSCPDCVRGILCARCNTVLPLLDDEEWLAAAVGYLGNDLVVQVLSEVRLW